MRNYAIVVLVFSFIFMQTWSAITFFDDPTGDFALTHRSGLVGSGEAGDSGGVSSASNQQKEATSAFWWEETEELSRRWLSRCAEELWDLIPL